MFGLWLLPINGDLLKLKRKNLIKPIGFDDNHIFNRLSLKRPAVERKVDRVVRCYYWEGTHQCLGSQCFWPKVGVCPIFNKLKNKMIRAKWLYGKDF